MWHPTTEQAGSHRPGDDRPGADWRTLYLRALDPEGLLPLHGRAPDAVDEALLLVDDQDRAHLTPDGIEDLTRPARQWQAGETELFRPVLTGPEADPAVRCVLLNCAPLALSAGAWLQWLSCSGNAETEPALRTLALYASDVGVGYPQADRGSDYRTVLRRHRLAEQSPGIRLAANEQIESFSFRLPGLLLAMSRLPDRYRPELLGADLWLRAVGLLPPLAALASVVRDPASATELRALDLGAVRPRDDVCALERSTDAVRSFLAEADPDAAVRLRRGFRWAEREVRQWSARLRAEAGLARHPDYDVWRLICSRARQAGVYHSRYRLAGRPLAQWFADVGDGPGPFLRALAESPLVRPGKPEASPLLRGLIGPKGPMFRIFTDTELAVLRRWISSLPARTAPPPSAASAVPSIPPRTEPDQPGTPATLTLGEAQRSWYVRDGSAQAEPAPPEPRDLGPAGQYTLRSAYHALLGRSDSPALRRFAHDYVLRWLARSGYRMNQAAVRLPALWDREQGLRGWLDDEHERHSREFEEGTTALPSREELIDSTVQLAPLIMIDGGWIQGFTDYRRASSPSGHFLFRTYWDELGNGEMALNHPKIYRDLLRSMDVELPATASREFADWPGFQDEAFALPVYWLSISRFPQTFMPEILGLNLAMELSGVGGGYRSAREALRHHGYDTQFVDLHNTIDNVATGHSGWAVDAIDCYMAELPDFLGPGHRTAVWDRVRLGHRSLDPPTGRAADLYAALKVALAARRTGRRGKPQETSRETARETPREMRS